MEKTAKPGLVRTFGLGMATIIVMSSIIGSGVFKKVAPMAEALGSPVLVILAWVLAGLLILCAVLSIAELAAMYPHAGGAFTWLERAYGRMTAFLYGWSCFTVIQSAAISSVAFVFAGAVNSIHPLPHLPADLEGLSFLGIHPLDNIGAKAVACALIIALTWANIRGARQGGFISLVFTLSIVLCIAFIIGAAFSSPAGGWHTLAVHGAGYPADGFTVVGFITVMFIALRHAFWGYEGWIALGFIGEEVKRPERNLPRAMAYGIVLITVLYVLINTAYLYVLPIGDLLDGLAADQNNIAAVVVMDHLFGKSGALIVSAMIIISTFGCTNATSLVSSRIYYAMARDGWFFRSAARTHPRHRTPHVALIYQCVWACLLVLSGSFDLLTDLVIIAAFVFYGLVVFGVLVLRRKRPAVPRPYKTFGYPVIPLIFTLLCVVLLVVTLIGSPARSAAGLVLILSGLPFFFHWNKSRRQRITKETS